MPNERLRGAVTAKGITVTRLAEIVGVDPKTGQRWITRDRLPHPTHRTKISSVLGVDEAYLWPALAEDPRTVSAGRAELVEFFPTRSAVPAHLWQTLVDSAKEHVDILVYAGLFFPEQYPVSRLAALAAHGCSIRLLLGDPAGAAIATRGVEEGFGTGIAHRVSLSLRYFEEILGEAGVQVRLHDTTLYASIYRADDAMLANTHVFGAPAAQNPVLHLRRVPGGRVFEHYMTSFDRVWAQSRPIDDIREALASIGGGLN